MTHTTASNRYSLLADIGGTNTRVALSEGTRVLEASIQRFSNAKYPDLVTILKQYVSEQGNVDCSGVCVAVAGPVRDRVATMTNLNWTIEPDSLAAATGAEIVSILNDLQAQGHALGHLKSSELTPISTGKEAGPNAAKLVIGVGTGFNAAAVYDTAGGRLVTPSECGHITMPARDEADLSLSRYVQSSHGFPGVEEVISGRGLERIYAWYSAEIAQKTIKSAAEIMASIVAKDDPLAVRTLTTFCRILGAVVGDLALIHLPFGGIYLVGGVSRAMVPYLADYGFSTAFRDKGRFSTFVDNFSITAIEDDYAALIGCAQHLSNLSK
ncbi:ROK family protein [Falsihalocynthiibacter sp. S25ZX9]|uniref:glucokinase n=1 Tax=Falsihalocynthiibacter sp. S25ZX9 TaxID=3240870 RepID=UPI00350EC32D